MTDFNFNKYLRNNPLLKETSGYGNYTQPEKMLEDESPVEMPDSDEENPWMPEVDGTEAYTVGEWKCYFDHPGVLVWSYGDIPFEKFLVYATPAWEDPNTTPIQVDVDQETVGNMSLPQGMFADFGEYAKAMQPKLQQIERDHSDDISVSMNEDEDYDYQSAEEFDLNPQDGENDPLGPDEELMEGSGKVDEVFNVMMEHMRSLIKKTGLDDDDVVDLRAKLANFFK